MPPASLTAAIPAVPSSSEPVATIATTLLPKARAADRNNGSTAGRTPFSDGPCVMRTTSPSMVM